MRERKCIVPLENVMPLLDCSGVYDHKKRAIIAGESVKISSLRLHTFKNSLICAYCGKKAQYFALERTTKSDPWNLELYGLFDGEEHMFTKDHIFPKSKGGKNHISNMQTMCRECNQLKADKVG